MITPRPREAALHAERMARIDGCPECVTSYQTPLGIQPAPHGFLADYVCTNCRHQWTTAWMDN